MSHKWLWHLDSRRGTVMAPCDYLANVQRRLGSTCTIARICAGSAGPRWTLASSTAIAVTQQARPEVTMPLSVRWFEASGLQTQQSPQSRGGSPCRSRGGFPERLRRSRGRSRFRVPQEATSVSERDTPACSCRGRIPAHGLDVQRPTAPSGDPHPLLRCGATASSRLTQRLCCRGGATKSRQRFCDVALR